MCRNDVVDWRNVQREQQYVDQERCLVERQTSVELFSVVYVTGNTLEITGSGCAESHLISRSTNIFFGVGLRVITGPGACAVHQGTRP